MLILQDFEDWDDVGLNVAKPPGLVHLYRDFSQHTNPSIDRQEFGCMVDLTSEWMVAKEELENLKTQLVRKY